MNTAQQKLVILDRDGVINADSAEYIKDADEWQPLPGSLEAIARFTQAGWKVAVATNQAGIGRGILDEYALARIHARMIEAVEDAGGRIEMIAFCPHHPDENCSCRKPQPGLLLRISEELGIPLDGVPYIGDSLKDVEAAGNAGAVPVLVLSGNGPKTLEELGDAALDVYPDLEAAANSLVEDGVAE